MGQSGDALLVGVDAAEVARELDGLYCRHLLAVHWSLAVTTRLEGEALFLLSEELDEVLDQNLASVGSWPTAWPSSERP
jgi:hypothetical protein